MISCGTRARSHRNPFTLMFSWLRTVADSYGQLLVLATVEAGLDLHQLRSCPTFKDGGRLERGASNSDRGESSHPAQFVRWLSGLDANLGCQGGDHPCNAGRSSTWVKNAKELVVTVHGLMSVGVHTRGHDQARRIRRLFLKLYQHCIVSPRARATSSGLAAVRLCNGRAGPCIISFLFATPVRAGLISSLVHRQRSTVSMVVKTSSFMPPLLVVAKW
jgi:hypothetical protein